MKMQRGILLALGVSMAVNILIAGAVIGMIAAKPAIHPGSAVQGPPIGRQGRAMGPGGHPGNRVGGDGGTILSKFNGPAFFQALPMAERRKLRRQLAGRAKEHRAIRQKIKRVQWQLLQLFNEDELDSPAIQQALAKLRAAEAEEKMMGQSLIIEVLQRLDPETRKQVLANTFQAPPNGRQGLQNPKGRSDGRRRPPPPMNDG